MTWKGSVACHLPFRDLHDYLAREWFQAKGFSTGKKLFLDFPDY